ncbi:MAG TPA: ATP-binding protein, partial [Saprospiraceae bacterium]|nr:ATP-binding protein [Saprospiraceae bacterium]
EVLWRPNFNKYRIYLALKNYKKADYYLNKSYNYVKDSPNRMNKGFVLHSVLVALKARGDQKVFEKYLKEYILFKKQGKGLSDMRHLGMDDYFTNQEEAKQTLERIVQTMIKDSISAERVSYRSMVLSELYEEDNEFAKAEQLYLKMLNLKPTAQEKKNLYINLYRMYKKKGDQQKAYKAIENYIAVQDSSFQQIFDGKIADYEVKYKTQEKERELLKKDLELTKSKNRQRSLIGLAFFLTTLGGVGYYIYRRKLKHQREMVEKDALIQKQRIADLEQKNKLLALNSMIEGQESERLRIAQDLHDGLGGLLTTVKAHFNAIEREIANIKEMNIYEKTNQLIDEACVEVRRIAHDMVPYSLKMNGLQGVLADIRQTVLGKGIHCDVDIHNVKEEVLGEQKVVMIYRIIQEVVNNALKHSGASHMLIQLVGHENGLNVMIEDNGKGFDVNQLLQGKGLGLKSIESRVKYLEGNLNIDSTPNQGTTINIEIPLYPINTH